MTAAPRVAAPLLVGGDTDDALRGEHGFSALVTVAKGDRETRVLFDAGRTPDGLVENMRRLETVALATSTSSCSATVTGITSRAWTGWCDGSGARTCPCSSTRSSGAAAVSRSRVRTRSSSPRRAGPPCRAPGFEIIEQRQPSFLLDGSLLVTGEVDRTTEFERGFPGHEAHRDGAWEPDPLILDDQALVARCADAASSS